MVGHLGVEPSVYLRIRQAPSPVEQRPAAGFDPPCTVALLADGGRIERPRATKTRPPVSNRAPCHSVNHPFEEGGRLERHGITAHRLAGEPGAPVRFTFRSAPRIRTEIRRVWTCWLCRLA